MELDRRSALGFAGCAALLLAQAGPALAAAAGAGEVRDGRRDFDFLVGDWTVAHRYLKPKPAGGYDWAQTTGTCTLRTILGGAGNVDDNLIGEGDKAHRGVTLRVFDPAAGTWSIWWIDGREPGRIGPPAHGAFKDGVGTFFGEDTLGDRPIKVRLIWSQIGPRACHWQQSYSTDGGATWEPNWEMSFARRT